MHQSLKLLIQLLITILTSNDLSMSLRLVEVRVPNYVIRGSSVQLECIYGLDDESLYSVKWYKDGNEFYRYIPRDIPSAQTFILPGISVDLHNCTDTVVTLINVSLQTSGRFRCEVSGEAPSFQTVTDNADMNVVSLPEHGYPKINGVRSRYQVNDWVSVNCSSGYAKPVVHLAWYINDAPVEAYALRKYDNIKALEDPDGLYASVLGLQFRVEKQHFYYGDLKLKCVSSLSNFYWRSTEESVQYDLPQGSPAMKPSYAGSNAIGHDQKQNHAVVLNKFLSFFQQREYHSDDRSSSIVSGAKWGTTQANVLLLAIVVVPIRDSRVFQMHRQMQQT